MEKNESLGWCMIPPNIMADPYLSANEKIMFGRIIGLTGARGYCFASNEWLGRQLGLKKGSISKIISSLSSNGVIRIEIIRQNGRVVERRIYVDFTHTPPLQKSHTPSTVIAEGYSTDIVGIHTSSKDKRVENSNTTEEESCDEIYSKEFASFWASYPNKKGKGYALKAWNKIKGVNKLANRIIASVEDHKTKDPQWKKDGGQYIPHPSTFLNGRGWEDEIEVETLQEQTVKQY